MTHLIAEDLVTGYGRVQIVHGLSLEAHDGEVTTIFGPNGCGKSTVLKAIAGSIPVWSGRVNLDGMDLTPLAAYQVVTSGLVMMPQGGGVFPQLSVLENLRMGAYTISARGVANERIDEALSDFPRLRERIKVQAGNLSGGEQMMLAIARTLIADPRFILFDEPSAGLSPKLAGEALERVASLAKRGVGILMVEQNIREALRVSDQIYVFVGGRNRFEGKAADIQSDSQLMELYLGGGESPDP